MASPKLQPLTLSGDERQVLEGWAWQRKTARALVLRSRIVLACANGSSVSTVAGDLGVTRVTAGKWRSRFLRDRLDGLADQPRPGRPSTITSTITSTSTVGQVERIVARSEQGDRGKQRGGTVLAAERRDLLLERLHRDGKLVAKDLAIELGLSDDSIRRDLRDLAAAGLCQRVYGGALPVSPATGPQAGRFAIAPDSKRRVGAAAARLITPGSTVILDGGTTALEVVMALPPDLDATIVTHSATTAAALASHPKVTVHTLSGQLHKQSVNASGAVAAEAAAGITADLALLITPGIHPQEGLTSADPQDAAITRIFAGRAAATYVMASTEKLGTVLPYKVTGLSEVTGIITDAPDHPTVQELRAQGTSVIAAT